MTNAEFYDYIRAEEEQAARQKMQRIINNTSAYKVYFVSNANCGSAVIFGKDVASAIEFCTQKYGNVLKIEKMQGE